MSTKNENIPNEIPDFVEERDVFGLIKPKHIEDHKTLDKMLHGENHRLHVQYASIIDRIIASVVDIIVVFTLIAIINETLKSFIPSYYGNVIPQLVLAIIIWVFYFGFFESSKFQATVGKMFLKIRVIDIEGKRISFIIAAFRSMAKVILMLPLAFDIWGINKDHRKQAMHDKIFDSYVIKK